MLADMACLRLGGVHGKTNIASVGTDSVVIL